MTWPCYCSQRLSAKTCSLSGAMLWTGRFLYPLVEYGMRHSICFSTLVPQQSPIEQCRLKLRRRRMESSLKFVTRVLECHAPFWTTSTPHFHSQPQWLHAADWGSG